MFPSLSMAKECLTCTHDERLMSSARHYCIVDVTISSILRLTLATLLQAVAFDVACSRVAEFLRPRGCSSVGTFIRSEGLHRRSLVVMRCLKTALIGLPDMSHGFLCVWRSRMLVWSQLRQCAPELLNSVKRGVAITRRRVGWHSRCMVHPLRAKNACRSPRKLIIGLFLSRSPRKLRTGLFLHASVPGMHRSTESRNAPSRRQRVAIAEL